MAYADRIPGSRRLSIIAGVAAVHGVIGYMFVTGMAVGFVEKYVPTLTTTNIPIDLPPPPDVPPPPPSLPKAARAPDVTATTPTIATPASTWTVAVDPTPPTTWPSTGTATTGTEATADPAPPVSLAIGARVRGDRKAWFSTDDYPAAAIRAEAEGTVAVSLAIAASGRVEGCTVTASSGSAALDQATCRLYRSRAHFTPARDAEGAAIASTYGDKVRWQLPPR